MRDIQLRRISYNILIAGLSLLAGFAFSKLDAFLGFSPLKNLVWPTVGSILLISGIWIRVLAHLEFDRAKITIFEISAQEKLTVKGIYYYSRNPFYIGLVLQQLGAAFVWQSPVALVAALGYCLFWHFFLLFIEEPSLAHNFTSTYQRYQQTTPRWFGRPQRPTNYK